MNEKEEKQLIERTMEDWGEYYFQVFSGKTAASYFNNDAEMRNLLKNDPRDITLNLRIDRKKKEAQYVWSFEDEDMGDLPYEYDDYDGVIEWLK